MDLPDTLTICPGSIMPLFGRTQYLFGAVVFTLKHTFLSDGFDSLKSDVTTSVKGPKNRIISRFKMFYVHNTFCHDCLSVRVVPVF